MTDLFKTAKGTLVMGASNLGGEVLRPSSSTGWGQHPSL
jgi:hypothetical protein